MKQQPLVIEQTYDASPTEVWQALTRPELMKEWYFDIPDFRAETGHAFSFLAGGECNKYWHVCKVTAVVPEKKLSYTWAYKEQPGQSEVTFELIPDGNKTTVRITHTGLETFPDNLPDFAITSFTEGWTYILGTGLKNHLEKK